MKVAMFGSGAVEEEDVSHYERMSIARRNQHQFILRMEMCQAVRRTKHRKAAQIATRKDAGILGCDIRQTQRTKLARNDSSSPRGWSKESTKGHLHYTRAEDGREEAGSIEIHRELSELPHQVAAEHRI